MADTPATILQVLAAEDNDQMRGARYNDLNSVYVRCRDWLAALQQHRGHGPSRREMTAIVDDLVGRLEKIRPR